MKKFTNVLLTIFAIGIMLALLAGVVAFIGYIVAMCIGGPVATEICRIILKVCMPWVIRFTSVIALIGLFAMYFSKTKALVINANEDKAEKGNTEKE